MGGLVNATLAVGRRFTCPARSQQIIGKGRARSSDACRVLAIIRWDLVPVVQLV